MNRKGFTLIELLAVIVILAIIALIATPNVINLIEESRKGAVESSARNISKTAENYYAQHTLLHNERVGEIDLTDGTLDYKNKPYKGYVYFDDNGNAYIKMYQDGYCVISDYDNTTEAVKMEAKECEIKSLIIFIDLDGGTLEDTYLEYEQGDTYGELPIPTKDGYTFIGWFDKNGKEITPDTVIDKSSTIYAKWEANVYTVTLTLTNGVIPEVTGWNIVNGVPTKEITYDSEYGPLPVPEREGYTFTGWYTGGGIQVEPTTILKISKDHVLSGQLIANKYEVTYVYNNGNSDTTETITYDTNYDLPTVNKTGYTFLGWYDGNTKIEDNSVVKILEDKTFEAKWEANTYTVTFKYNDNSTSDTIKEVTYDENYGELPNPVRTGYEFLGWYDGNTLVTSDTKVQLTSNQTLNAKWNTNKYNVTFVYNDGITSNTNKEVAYDSTYGTLPSPSKTGYTFNGWYDGSTKVESSTTVKITSDQTLEAKWEPNMYTVTFVYDNGSSNTTSTVTYDGSYTLPTPTKTGYIFQGWFTDSDVSITSESKVNIASNHTLTAKWSQSGYTVTYNANGGSVTPTSASVTYDNAYGSLPTPSRTGYTFQGWYTAASGGTEVTASTVVKTAGNHSIYAQWTANTYTVTFVYGNGSSNTTATVTYDGTYTLPSVSRTGYTFGGWATTGGVVVTSSTKVTATSNHTLTAQWTAITYKVAYNANGGSGTMSSVTHTYDTTKNLTANTFTRTGYTFAGWATSSSGSVAYANSASVKNLTSTKGATVTLYAKWTANTYTVAYNANGGSGTMSSVTHTYDTAKNLTVNAFTRTGYNFSGWATSSSGSVAYSNGVSVKNLTSTSGATVTLFAKWTAKTYTVTFNANGGTTPTATKTVTYASTYSTLPTPTRSGYTFLGWYTATSGGSQVTSSTTVSITANQTLYAQWKAPVGDKVSATNDTLFYVQNGNLYYSWTKTSSPYWTVASTVASGNVTAAAATDDTLFYVQNGNLYYSWTKTSSPYWTVASTVASGNVTAVAATDDTLFYAQNGNLYYSWTKTSSPYWKVASTVASGNVTAVAATDDTLFYVQNGNLYYSWTKTSSPYWTVASTVASSL